MNSVIHAQVYFFTFWHILDKIVIHVMFLHCLHDSVLVFDVDTVEKLRQIGIVGNLVGTLPKAPQQNVFLGLPLQLSIYEVLWLVENRHASIVDSANYHKEAQPFPGTALIGKSVEYAITPDTSKSLAQCTMTTQEYLSRQTLPPLFEQKRKAFNKLRNKGYYLMPGLLFGGVFVAYPGDPLRFHSHLIVKAVERDEDVMPIEIVTSGRLATAVKKLHLLMADNDAYSIEWAGFG